MILEIKSAFTFYSSLGCKFSNDIPGFEPCQDMCASVAFESLKFTVFLA